jgi:pimeloyl-ACP methyl ester carboxylesterase
LFYSNQRISATTTHNTASNQFVDVDGVRYAYRRFGKPNGMPLLLLPHFIGTMDWWDPELPDGLATTREVIVFDNRGVGLTQLDVLGFSIGGMVAQKLVLNYPEDVRKLMLVGTGPRGGSGMQEQKPHVVKALTDAGPDPKSARPFLFFSHSANGQAAAQQFMARTAERKVDPDPGPSMQIMQAQGEALGEWGLAASHAFMSRLAGLKHSALVMNGNNDIMVDTVNSYTMAQAIPKAQLVIYPDSGHGPLFQYASLFVQHTNLFLDRNDL